MSGVTSADIESNMFNGHALDPCCTEASFGFYAMALDFGGPVTFKYNVEEDWPGRPFNFGTTVTNGIDVDYNFIKGWVYRAPQGHSEAFLFGFSDSAPTSIDHVNVEYNVFWETKDAASTGQSPIYLSDGNGSGNTYNNGLIKGNVIIANTVQGCLPATGVIADGTLTSGILTINHTTGTICQGQGVSGTAMNLYLNTGGGTGVGSTWETDCESQAASTAQCPVLPLYNNNASAAVASTTFSNGVFNSLASMAHEDYGAVVFSDNWTDTTAIWRNLMAYSKRVMFDRRSRNQQFQPDNRRGG